MKQLFLGKPALWKRFLNYLVRWRMCSRIASVSVLVVERRLNSSSRSSLENLSSAVLIEL